MPPSLLNEIELDQLHRDIDHQELVNLLHIYLEELPIRLKTIRVLLRAQHTSQAENILHQLYASSATLGAEQLAQRCQHLEQRLQTKSAIGQSELERLLDQLDHLGEQTAHALTSWLD